MLLFGHRPRKSHFMDLLTEFTTLMYGFVRIIPFFIPQVLLAAVGITVTRAINKIVTPALKDTRGYKSWWGKVVLKAMDVAEGDYIPDVAIGDDPLSKIFFISDGLLE